MSLSLSKYQYFSLFWIHISTQQYRFIFTTCFLQSELPNNGARCRCRRFPSRRSCCGSWIGPDCGSFWPTSRPSPPSGCRETPSAFGELTLGPTWTADLWKKRGGLFFGETDAYLKANCSSSAARTVSFEFCWFAAAVSCLVYGFHNEDVLGSTLEPVHSVVVLLDVWYNHPAVGRVAQTWNADRHHEKCRWGIGLIQRL